MMKMCCKKSEVLVEYYLSVFRATEHLNGRGKINMKKWETPKVVEEQFAANSNVSACYSLVCTLPGDNPYTEDGSKDNWIYSSKVKDRAKYNAIWGQQTFPDVLHSEKHDENCALPARFNDVTGVFKESGGNAAQVSNIQIDKANQVAAGRYPAIWTSNFGVGIFNRNYHHIGYAVDDSVGHPLRS